MTRQWTNKLIFKFLDEFEKEPVIWNPKNTGYKGKIELEDAWNRLSFQMDMPLHMLKRKIKCLMVTYRLHIKRYRDAIRKGEDYKPIWFAFKKMDSFLRPVYQDFINKKDEEEVTTKATSSSDPPVDSKEGIVIIDAENTNPIEPQKPTCVEKLDQPNTIEEFPVTTMPKNNSFDPISVTNCNEGTENSSKEDDECDLFGKLIAKKLRKFPGTHREEIMFDIQGLILQRANAIMSNGGR